MLLLLHVDHFFLFSVCDLNFLLGFNFARIFMRGYLISRFFATAENAKLSTNIGKNQKKSYGENVRHYIQNFNVVFIA